MLGFSSGKQKIYIYSIRTTYLFRKKRLAFISNIILSFKFKQQIGQKVKVSDKKLNHRTKRKQKWKKEN